MEVEAEIESVAKAETEPGHKRQRCSAGGKSRGSREGRGRTYISQLRYYKIKQHAAHLAIATMLLSKFYEQPVKHLLDNKAITRYCWPALSSNVQ